MRHTGWILRRREGVRRNANTRGPAVTAFEIPVPDPTQEIPGGLRFTPESLLFELAGDEIAQRFERGVRIGTVGADRDDRTVSGGEHHETHD